jgi:hypothetical protein
MEATMRRLGIVVIVTGLLLASVGVSSAQAPQLTVTAPANGSAVDGTDVTVTFNVTGIAIVPSTVPLERAGLQPDANRPGEGHVHFMLDLGPLVVWTSAAPYTFTNVPPGEHQLMVEVVNNDHSSFNPPVIQQIRFRSSASQMLPKTGAANRDVTSVYSGLLALSGLAILGAGLLLRRRVA